MSRLVPTAVFFHWALVFFIIGFSNTSVKAQRYHIKDSFVGSGFFDSWTWETFQDPTHGRVNYVDLETAIARNLSYATGDSFVMRADHWSTVEPFARGRDSIRVKSKEAYSESLLVLDLAHMPEGCATWPAWWTLSRNGPWPRGGEIDILEGVNLNSQNAATLHTSGDCTMPVDRKQTGQTSSTDCDAAANGNQGCGTTFSKSTSYGSAFNQGGGGWYVIQRSEKHGINVWFWERNDESVPPSVKYGSGDLERNGDWGCPEAAFTFDLCSYPDHFDEHQIIFDLTFCGDWAGSTFAASGCGTMSCDDYVDQKPEEFENAFWEIKSLRVYTPAKDNMDGAMQPFLIAHHHFH